jgi:hypothetical protein
MYPNLKLQIWKSGVRQNRLAQMVGIHETLLSKIVNGFRAPDVECRTGLRARWKATRNGSSPRGTWFWTISIRSRAK